MSVGIYGPIYHGQLGNSIARELIVEEHVSTPSMLSEIRSRFVKNFSWRFEFPRGMSKYNNGPFGDKPPLP